MVADLVHSDNTNYIVIAFSFLSLAKRAKWRVVALSSCRLVASESRQSARCRAARCNLVAWFISQFFDLSQATM
jgi:hypothetical protein